MAFVVMMATGFIIVRYGLAWSPFGADDEKRQVFIGEQHAYTHLTCLMWQLIAATVLAVVTFLPSSNLFFYVGFTLAERVLYTPSMGFVIVGVLLLAKLGRSGVM